MELPPLADSNVLAFDQTGERLLPNAQIIRETTAEHHGALVRHIVEAVTVSRGEVTAVYLRPEAMPFCSEFRTGAPGRTRTANWHNSRLVRRGRVSATSSPPRQRPTRRQLEVLQTYISVGSIAAAAFELGISKTTARQHLSGLYRRTGCPNAAQAAYWLGARSAHSRSEIGEPVQPTLRLGFGTSYRASR